MLGRATETDRSRRCWLICRLSSSIGSWLRRRSRLLACGNAALSAANWAAGGPGGSSSGAKISTDTVYGKPGKLRSCGRRPHARCSSGGIVRLHTGHTGARSCWSCVAMCCLMHPSQYTCTQPSARAVPFVPRVSMHIGHSRAVREPGSLTGSSRSRLLHANSPRALLAAPRGSSSSDSTIGF